MALTEVVKSLLALPVEISYQLAAAYMHGLMPWYRDQSDSIEVTEVGSRVTIYHG